MLTFYSRTLLSAVLLPLAVTVLAVAQPNPADVTIGTIEVADGVYMLTGAGGNMGLSVGEDGAFLIDDQFAPLTPKIKAAIAEVTDKPVQFVVNTHWHGDHTGGNENLAGDGAVVVAHENVRKRMSTDQFMAAFDRTVPASPAGALPVITFPGELTFHWNGDAIDVFHVPGAHTDGDAIVHFTKANVVHMGDVFFNGTYPFIDQGSGGSIDGVIAAVEATLAAVNDSTKFIPGHGSLAGADALRAFHQMLVTSRDAIAELIAEGKTKEEAVAAKPTADLDETWGQGFINPDLWIGMVYEQLAQ
jgi:glyoxylase-like metal-dependent hydrolase (beta-lactamase superfamily II)